MEPKQKWTCWKEDGDLQMWACGNGESSYGVWFSDEQQAQAMCDELNNVERLRSQVEAMRVAGQPETVEQLGFGNYCWIEQYRYRKEGNEMYQYKVIGRLESNAYVDVPVRSGTGFHGQENVLHDKVVPVVACICCGVGETEVRKFRLSDVHVSNPWTASLNPTPTAEPK